MNLVSAGRREADGNEAQKRDHSWWEAFCWRLALEQSLKAIDELISRYNQMADWHHEEAEKAREKMREAADRLAAIDEFVTGVDDVLKDKTMSGRFDRAKAITLLKAREVGVDPGATDAALAIRLTEEKKNAEQERATWTRQYDQSKADADFHDDMERENRRKAQELIERRDAIRSAGYQPGEEVA